MDNVHIAGVHSPKIKNVYFSGTTVPDTGKGVCYDLDYIASGGAAIVANENRFQIVQAAGSTNNRAFAGVVMPGFGGEAGNRWIQIAEPGGTAYVAFGGVSPTVNASLLTCSADAVDAGRFTLGGLPGRGTARALQTSTAGVSNAEGNKFALLDGSAVIATAAGVSTITATGIGTACGYVAALTAPTGDTVALIGGAADADSDISAVAGEYAVATVPTADTITISGYTDPGDTDVVVYVRKGNPLLFAYLQDGEESGCIEYITPTNADAVASMVGGRTYVCGGWTMAADSTFTLADGVTDDQRKSFMCLGTLTTKEYVVTVTSGVQGDVTTGLGTYELNAAGDFVDLRWHGCGGGGGAGQWVIEGQAGGTIT